MSEAAYRIRELSQPPTPFIRRDYVSVLNGTDDQGKRTYLYDGVLSANVLYVQDLQFEQIGGNTWTKLQADNCWVFDTGARISVLPKTLITDLQIATWPLCERGFNRVLRGAFVELSGTQGKGQDRPGIETCPIEHVLFGFPSLPDVKFPALCAISKKSTIPLIAESWIEPYFVEEEVRCPRLHGRPETWITGKCLHLKENAGTPRDKPFLPPPSKDVGP